LSTSFSGFRDGHCHPLFASREANGPQLTATTVSGIVDEIRNFIASNPGLAWVDAASFEPDLAATGQLTAAALDAASTTVPIVVHAADHHSIWVNAAALRIAGLTENVPALVGASIDVDQRGHATGLLREWNAMTLIYDHQPLPSLEDDLQSLLRGQERLLAAGIVAVQDAWIDPGMELVYLHAASNGALKMRVNLAPRIAPENWQAGLEFAKKTRSACRALGNPLLTSNTVKIFIDGVFSSQTALTSSHYCDGSRAEALWDTLALHEMAIAADSAGFQLHFHAIGDDAVSRALAAVEAVELANGPVDRRPVIAHAELINPLDYSRLRRNGIVVCQQPIWAVPGASAEDVGVKLGPAAMERLYPIKDLLSAGAIVSFGSDWPVSDPEPLAGILAAEIRSADPRSTTGLNPSQRISRAEAIRAYSAGSAFQLGQETILSEDEVVFDRDILHCSPEELLEARVLSVRVAGQQVWTQQ
jgi:hypothetical protein